MKKLRRIGYAKLGRSMPLSLSKCGSNGGDVEMMPTVQVLARRHPNVEFVLVGRNTGEDPRDVGLPTNVTNPWVKWRSRLREMFNAEGLSHPNLSIEEHIRVLEIMQSLTLDTFEELDGVVMWVGQHGTTNTPLPSVKNRDVLTKPYDWATLYASYLLQGINAWRDVDPFNREEVLLNADPRNVVKYRDSKWPWRHPVLSQYDVTNRVKHERYGNGLFLFSEFLHPPGSELSDWLGHQDDATIWTSRTRSVYSRLEISGLLPGTPFADLIRFNDSHTSRAYDFGIVFNETKREVARERSRRYILENWVWPLSPGFVAGKWSDATLRELKLPIPIYPVDVKDYFFLLQSTRCTLTTPSSGSGWATAKPWEAFAAGVVCFFHPAYDDQNHILRDAPEWLHDWLRVSSPEELRDRIRTMTTMPNFWLEVVKAQRQHYEDALNELHYLREIEKRLSL